MPAEATEKTAQILLKAENLTRLHGEHCVVDNISIELHKGQVLGLLGLNGAGKSSTLKMLCGVMAPSAGEVSVCGYSMRDAALQAKRHLGYLPEHPPLYLDMRVDDYLRFAARLRGIRKTQVKSALERVKNDCHLTQVGRRIIGNLSKGYRQRIGLAQALIHEPSVIVLDEPSSGLDPHQMSEMRKLILRLAPQHGIIFSTHLLSEATAICTEVCVLHNGKMVNKQSLGQKHSNDITRLSLTLRESISIADLLRLPGVINATSTPGHQYRLSVQTSQQDRLLAQIIEKGLHVLEFGPEKHQLETLFNELMQHDSITSGPAAGTAQQIATTAATKKPSNRHQASKVEKV